MKNITIIVVIALSILVTGCGRTEPVKTINQEISQIKSYNNASSVEPIENPEPLFDIEKAQKEHDESLKTFIGDYVKKFEKNNEELSKTLLVNYKGLPNPVETESSIQTYSKLVESLPNKNAIYSLITYSKSSNQYNDFSGELGRVNTTNYMCSNKSKECKKDDIVDNAEKAGQPGYTKMYGFYCIQGWDDVAKKIYSSLCGEGGDNSEFGIFEYESGKSTIIGKRGSLYYLALDKNLTKFAMERVTSQYFLPSDIELYSTVNLSKPYKIISLEKVFSPDTTVQGYFTFIWDKTDESLAHISYQNQKFIVNLETGKIISE